MPKLTVKDPFVLKGQRQLTEVFGGTPEEAQVRKAAGIDLIVTPESPNPKAIHEAAPNTFLTIGLFYGRYSRKTTCDPWRP